MFSGTALKDQVGFSHPTVTYSRQRPLRGTLLASPPSRGIRVFELRPKRDCIAHLSLTRAELGSASESRLWKAELE